MKQKEFVSWRAPEYVFKKKTLLWYTDVTIVFVVALTCLLLLDLKFGAFISLFLFWAFLAKANEHPHLVNYEVSPKGIQIGDRAVMYSELRSFSVDKTKNTPVITLYLEDSFSLPITMVVKKDHIEEVVEQLLPNVPIDTRFSFSRWLSHWLHY
jgi:hypothetical protein